ncbi:MAG: NPCBM/NEW2 domain-containing protein [Lentisphaeria bacterium]|nr:NPCBM/NEW2 domain-containing protein [Lentisphaeria bacterium]
MGERRNLLLCFVAALALVGSVLAESAANDGAWVDAMLFARGVFGEHEKASVFKPFVSRRFKAREKPERIVVDITGVKLLWLVCNDGGNGTGADHGVWGEATIVAADGTKVRLATLEPLAAMTGWRHFQVNKGYTGSPLVIGGQKIADGLWLHSRGYVCYRIDGRYKRFESWIGLDDHAQVSGCVGFEVRDRMAPGIAFQAFWRQHGHRFPEKTKWLMADLSEAERRAWLMQGADTDVERKLISSACEELGGGARAYRSRLEELTRAGTHGTDPAWLKLFLEVRSRMAAYRELVETMRFCERTLAMVEEAAPNSQFSGAVRTLRGTVDASREDPGADFAALDQKIRVLRRRVVFSHPALGFDTLLVNKRPPPSFPHQCDQYLGRHSRPGPGPVLVRNWKSDHPEETVLLEGKLPPGTVTHPDLSFEGDRILFSYCDHSETDRSLRRFSIHEMGLDGTGLRQLTGTAADPLETLDGRQTVMVEDFDPCYLPDGGIAFISTRCQSFGRCHHRRYNPSYMLYWMDGDGKGIRQLSFGEANEWDPSVLADGRIIYTRWDYINRHDTLYQSLWTMRPDGTGVAHFYGNYTRNPCMVAEARSIPGSRKVVCTATAHHAYTTGSILALDPQRGVDGVAPVERITPEVRFPETEGWGMDNCCCTPWPLTEDLYLVARAPGEPLDLRRRVQSVQAYSIWLIDTLGGRELVYRDKMMSCFSPMPVRPRLRPPVLASMLPAEPKSRMGTFYVQDVRMPSREYGGRIAALRVNAIIGQPTASVPHRGKVRQEIVKRIVGTVPVRADGSVAFRAPSGMPLQLQALDKDGKAVMTMRSFVHLQAGEFAGCVGCHEHRLSAPLRTSAPTAATYVDLTPPTGPRYPGGLSYQRTVQPVLDRYCISCHGLGRKAGGVSLLGTQVEFPIDGYPGWPKTIRASESYQTLVHHPKGLVKIAQRNRESVFSKPNDYFANAGKLAGFLLAGHCPALLEDRPSLSRIFDWLDLNAQYNGDYSWNRPGDRGPDPAGQRALRAFLAKRFGAVFSGQPFAALVNPALVSESRVLKAVLSMDAGGWGQFGERAFASENDPGYAVLRGLVVKSLPPSKVDDHGTCGRGKCVCGCCWVREVRAKRRASSADGD